MPEQPPNATKGPTRLLILVHNVQSTRLHSQFPPNLQAPKRDPPRNFGRAQSLHEALSKAPSAQNPSPRFQLRQNILQNLYLARRLRLILSFFISIEMHTVNPAHNQKEHKGNHKETAQGVQK